MTDFAQSTIKIRGETFTVRELDGKTMRESKRLIETDRHRLDFFIASKGLVEPKLTEQELMERPNIFADKLSTEILRLTKTDDDSKNA